MDIKVPQLSTNQAFDFAKSLVLNDLEEKFKFDIRLNAARIVLLNDILECSVDMARG